MKPHYGSELKQFCVTPRYMVARLEVMPVSWTVHELVSLPIHVVSVPFRYVLSRVVQGDGEWGWDVRPPLTNEAKVLQTCTCCSLSQRC